MESEPSKFEYPEFIARFYDVIYDQLRTGIDHSFYLSRMKESKEKVLEIGVGTGRFFKNALEEGIDVYGIDVSRHMIDVLKSNIPAVHHHRVSVQNILDFHFDQKFPLILAPFRMFSHLKEVSDQILALNHVSEYLSNDGIFIFDLYNPDPGILKNGFTNFVDSEQEYAPDEHLRRIVNSTNDLVNQVTHVKFTLEWTEKGQNFSRDWEFDMRYFFRWELEHLIARSSLELIEILGDFEGNKLASDSKEFICICRKANR